MHISSDIVFLLVTIVTPHISDALTETEKNNLVQGHNRWRKEDGRLPIDWDPELEAWAKWVISCNADYPGPRHSFTNFYRFGSDTSLDDVLSAWRREGRNIFLERGCRTPFDRTRCNRYRNMVEARLTSMACEVSQCSSMRQLVCIYDNIADRE